MAESFSVRAILSAQDRGFSSTLKSALKSTESLGSKIKSGFAFGILTGAGQQAFSCLTNGVRDLISEIDTSNAAWKTFTGNMKMLGKSDKEIAGVKKELQSFAEQTISSSSDMAQTYSQLAAVGTKNCTKLVKGFGGLASAAENPQQAMKTLSQQATQMAAKPSVAWQDFKLMLEQTPAGIAAVAKEMGMTTSELVTAVQDGKVKTEDFFDAISKVGTNKAFTKLATEYKTVGQAMDGLKETVGNKLTPAFDILSQKAIGGISGIIDKIGEIDGEAIAQKVTVGLEKAQPYWEAFKKILAATGKVLKSVGGFLIEHSDAISKALPFVLGLAAAYKGFTVINKVVPGMSKFTQYLTSLAGKGIGSLAGKLFGVAAGERAAGAAGTTSATQVAAAAKSFMMMGAAVLMISAGFALLAFSAVSVANAGPAAIAVLFGLIAAVALLGAGMTVMLKTLAPMSAQLIPAAAAMLMLGGAVLLVAAGFALMAYAATSLASAGGLAIGVMAGMLVAVGLLAVGAAALGPALTAGAVGLLAFGAAVLLVGAGTLMACAGLALLATKLPVIAAYGTTAAGAIVALGASMFVFSAGAIVAGAGALVLGAGLVVAGAGLAVFGAGMIAGAAGTLAMAVALRLVGSQLKSIASNAKSAQSSLNSMRTSVKVVESGLDALGSKAKSAMNKLTSAFDNAASKAKSAGQKVGTGFTQGMQSGLNKAPSMASKAVRSAVSRLRSGRSGAYSAGAYISQGFASGMQSCLGAVRAAAAALASAAEAAVRAKAKIHSPSRVTGKLGQYWGKGLGLGMLKEARFVERASEKLVSIPNITTPRLAAAYSGEMSADYDYYRNSEYTIEVPLTVDGREVARATASYTQEELNKKQTRENRKRGKA